MKANMNQRDEDMFFTVCNDEGEEVKCELLLTFHDLAHRQTGVTGIGDEDFLSALLSLAQTGVGQIVGTQDHILGRNGNRLAVLATILLEFVKDISPSLPSRHAKKSSITSA